MFPRYLVPALALAAAAPVSHALELADGDVSLKFGIRLQSRVEFANAKDAAGNDYDPWAEASTDDPQAVNFYIRRARLYLKGTWKEDTKFNLTFYNDKIGVSPDSRSKESGTEAKVRYAWVSHGFKTEQLSHDIRFGLTKPQLIAAHTDSSSRAIFPTGRFASGGKEVDRKIGLLYQLKHPVFTAWLSYFEADDKTDAEDFNDFQFAVRVATGLKEEWAISKRSESFLGKEGFHHQLGAGVGVVSDGGDDEDGNTIFTVDYLAHYEQLTALAEFVLNSPEADGVGDHQAFNIQAAYAFPLESGHVVEPALRFQLVDEDTDLDEFTVLNEEGGESGSYVDVGVNYYIDGHHNKFQLALQSFSPEEGEGDATVVRFAHQLNF